MSATTPLEALGEPLFYEVDAAESLSLDAPAPRLEQSQRTRIRHLAGMQKEALVTSSPSGTTWRLASDEGDYLDGDDVAPCPLAFVTTGMVCSFANRIRALADERDVALGDLELVQDNYYTMRGSALRGDMVGGALDPELDVRVDAAADEATVARLVEDAVATAPVAGLLSGEMTNRFALALNGQRRSTDRVAELDVPLLAGAAADFDDVELRAGAGAIGSRGDGGAYQPLARNTGRTTEPFAGDRSRYTDGASSSLAEEQDRVLHLRGTCDVHDDGLKAVEVQLYSPQGSVFELVSDEPEGHGGRGRAPDAMTYVAAGVGFCFMTQVGRYAGIVGRDLDHYRIVQDTHVATGRVGEAAGGVAGSAVAVESGGAASIEPARADPIETHLSLDSPEDGAFARELLDMAEQTCFVHALCRTDVAPRVSVTIR